MMPLSRIRGFDRTFSPDGHSDIADVLAAPWSPDPGSIRHFRTSANSVLTLTRHGERSFLRASLASERDRRTIEDELAMLDSLSAQGIPVVQAIPSDNGGVIETIATSMGDWHVVLFAALPGTIRDADDLSVNDYALWGAAVGRIHAGLAMRSRNSITRPPSWITALDVIGTKDVIAADARDGAARLRATLEQLPTSPEWYGLLHGDLELDNLTWEGETIHALDFDAASHGWYLLDLAKALSDPFDSGLSVGSPEIAAFLGAYRQHQPLPDSAIALLPDFTLLSHAVDYAAIEHAMDMTQSGADVDWLHRLIGGLVEGMARIESELAAYSPA